MIIKYAGMTQESRDPKDVTYWFDVKLVDLKWTYIAVGFNSKKEFTRGSKTFFELDSEIRDTIIEAVKSFANEVIR